MPAFSQLSQAILSTCHHDLQRLFNAVVIGYDCTIISGKRNQAEQNRLYLIGSSKLKYPESKHNKIPSMAVDVAPYFPEDPHIRWHDFQSFYNFAGYVQAVADYLEIPIRWGGDWDMDKDLHDQNFIDLVHFELVEEV